MTTLFFDEVLRTPAGPDAVRNIRVHLLERALGAGVDESEAWKMAAVADELVSNMEEHGNAKWVRVQAELPQGKDPLRLRLKDNSSGFNLVLATAEANPPTGDNDRGLGMWLIRQATRSLRQQRTAKGETETILEF
jgi:anti-sigma regulatory factor (Ser/Thr protein kinase)